MNLISRFFGAISGTIMGCLSGLALGGYYYAREQKSLVNKIGYFLGGTFVGLFSGLARGAMTGITEGFAAGLSSPKKMYIHYYGVEDKNKELKDHINKLHTNPERITPLLTEYQEFDFINYLKTLPDDAAKVRVVEEFEYYQAYLKKVCPISLKPVSEHRRPIELKVNHNSLTEEYVYDRDALWNHIRYTEANNGYFLFAKPTTTSSLKKEDLLAINIPQRIINFVKDAIQRLASFSQTREVFAKLGVTHPVIQPVVNNESAPLMQSMKEDSRPPASNYSTFDSAEEEEPETENQQIENQTLLP